MAPDVIGDMVEFSLGLLVTAGDYARAIQPQVGGPDQKDGHNAWVSALTDADLSVQNFFEVALLARYPEIGFYGEEHARSLNQRYFLQNAEVSVYLDPINGTFLYKNQRPGWDILVSIARHRQLMAAVSYVPSSGRFFLAIRGRGAFTGDRRNPRLQDCWPLHTKPGSRSCLTYQAPDLAERLKGEFRCYDMVADDDPARGLDNLNEIFTGRLGAFACRDSEALDWGAAAFIAVAAGARASRLDGAPLTFFDDFDPQERVEMLVAADSATHAEIMSRLQRL